jgi:sigma-B regulation protein RsbU (phosphoserine phosphatase)
MASKNPDFEKLRAENERLKKSVAELSMLNEFAQIISSTMALDKVLDKVVAASLKAIDAEQGTIHLVQSLEGDAPFRTLIRKADQTTPMDKYRLDVELSGWMIRNRKPLLINDFSKDKIFNKASSERKIRSLLAVPLLCKGQLIGVLNLFNKKHAQGFNLDDQRLLSIIASQSAQVIENARLYEEEKQLRQYEQDLQMARNIQNNLLPNKNPTIPGFEVAGKSYAAREVGGDYFDFIDLGNGRWNIALGDVSGKGIAAALLMANLQATLRTQAQSNIFLVDSVAKTNRFLYFNTEANQFATLFCGVLDAPAKTFTYVNAGHNYPFLLTPAGQFQELHTGGLILGLLPEVSFAENKRQLSPGEILVIYSDGVTEAENELEDQFGEKRLQEMIKQNQNCSAEELVDRIYNAVTEFCGSAKQSDDITLVIIKAL